MPRLGCWAPGSGRAFRYSTLGKRQGGQAKLQFTGHLQLEPWATSLCLLLGEGSVSS